MNRNNEWERRVIVVGGDHHNTLWLVRCLGAANYEPYVIIHTERRHSFVARSRFATHCECLQLRSDDDLLDILFRLRQRSPIPILCASDEAMAIIDRNADLLKSDFLFFTMEKGPSINYWMRKEHLMAAAVKAGFRVPRSWCFRNYDEYQKFLPDLVFPCLIKPERSCDGSKGDFHICQSKAELSEELSRLFTRGMTSVIVSEYLKPDTEYTLLGVSLPNSRRRVLPGMVHKTLRCNREDNLGMIIYGCLQPHVTSELRDKVDRMLDMIPYSGLFSFDFIEKGGELIFLEINFRADGNTFMAMRGGVNMPLLWMNDVLNKETEQCPINIKKPVYALLEFPYLKNRRTLNPFKIAKEVFRADVYSIWWRRDPKPFLYKFIYAFKH